jgi:8-oxo-dGTP diphosphatase
MTVLIRRGRVLLAHRHPGRRWYPGCWDLVGGHLEPGESPEQAARRECREEIDVDLTELHPVEVALDDPEIEAHAFLATSWRGEPRNAAPDEHDALGWFTREDLLLLRLADPSYLAWLTGLLTEHESHPGEPGSHHGSRA